jgi:RND family efflux transporter MFP subunit
MKLVIMSAVLLTAGAGVTGTLWVAGSRPAPESRPFAARADAVAANGSVEGARPEVAIRPEVSGSIAAIPFRENDMVRAGDVLVELRNDLQKCQVDLARAEANEARADQQQCKAEAERSTRLGTGAVSRERLDADRFRLHKAQAKLDAAEARLRVAQAELARTRVLATTSGRVLRVYAEPGEQGGPATPQPVLLLADDSRRRVRAFVDEIDAHRVAVGQRADITCDGLSDIVFGGRVVQVLPRMGRRPLSTDAPDEYKDIYSREVLIDLDAGRELALNLRVKVLIHTDSREGTR